MPQHCHVLDFSVEKSIQLMLKIYERNEIDYLRQSKLDILAFYVFQLKLKACVQAQNNPNFLFRLI